MHILTQSKNINSNNKQIKKIPIVSIPQSQPGAKVRKTLQVSERKMIKFILVG